jgi:hypothetical protein
MAKSNAKDLEEVSVTMVGDMASALQIASYQRRSSGEDNCDVTGLVQEAVSDWLHKEIYGSSPGTEDTDQVATGPKTPNPAASQPTDEDALSVGRKLAPIIILGIVLVGFIGWGLLRSTGPGVQANASSPVVALPVPTGFLIIDAQPWAQVERVWDPSGVEMVLPEDRYTPLRLELPTQHYSVSLIRPDSPTPQTCEAQVTDSETIRCAPLAIDVDATLLFKETGWWK